MIPLTKKQLEQIREYLAAYGIRTTDFPDAPTVTANDLVAIVQGGVNKKVKISDLFDPELLPSLIVDITVKDDWDSITDDDHDSALSARLGKQLRDSLNPTVIVNSWTSPGITHGDYALSAALGYDLYTRFQNLAEPIDNLNEQSTSGKPLDAHQGYVLANMIDSRPTLRENNGLITASWNNGASTVQFYNKAYIDNLTPGPGPGGSSYLYDLNDVSINPASLLGGEALVYDNTLGKWIAGTVSSSDTWRPIQIEGDTLDSVPSTDTLKIKQGTNVTFATSRDSSNNITTLIISSTGGSSSGGGYIGKSSVQPSEYLGQPLVGLGIIELGMGSSDKKIYFGDRTAQNPAYIEFVTPLSGESYFRFSHGIASYSFISAAGVNSDSGGGGGATSLNDLTDVSLGTPSDGYVLTYESSSGLWKAKPGQTETPAAANWGSIGGTLSNQTDLQDALNAKANTTSLASVATTGNYADLTNKPSIPSSVVQYVSQSLTSSQQAQARTNIGAGTYSKPSGGIPKTDLVSSVQTSLEKADTAVQPGSVKTLTFGTNGSPNTYNPLGSSNYTVGMTDLTNIIGYGNGAYVQIGDAKITYNNGTLYIERVSTGQIVNVFASGAVTAGSTN